MEEWSKTLDEGKCSRARDVRAFTGNFDFLTFTTFTESRVFHKKVFLKTTPSLGDFPLRKWKVFPLLQHEKVNRVPNTLIIGCEIACYERFCEGCESKKVQNCWVRVHTRAGESPLIERKGKRKSGWGRRAKARGQWEIKSCEMISKNVGDFPKNVGENLEKLRRFLRNLRSLVVMLAGCAWCVGQRIETEPSCLMGPCYLGGIGFSFSFAPPVANPVRPLFAENEQSRILQRLGKSEEDEPKHPFGRERKGEQQGGRKPKDSSQHSRQAPTVQCEKRA